MSISPAELQKLALSEVVYGKSLPVDNTLNPRTIEELIKSGRIEGASYDDIAGTYIFSKPQLLALSTMLDYTLINFTPNTGNGFAGAAFQAPDPKDASGNPILDANGNPTKGEIVFAFRGTELLSDNLNDLSQDLKIMMAEEGVLDAQFSDFYSLLVDIIQKAMRLLRPQLISAIFKP